MILIMKEESELERIRAEATWKDQLFLHNPKLYKKLYIDAQKADEQMIQYLVPKTLGDVAQVLDTIKQAGGPDLDFKLEESLDDDWSWTEKFKRQDDSESTDRTESTEDVDAFEALDTQNND